MFVLQTTCWLFREGRDEKFQWALLRKNIIVAYVSIELIKKGTERRKCFSTTSTGELCISANPGATGPVQSAPEICFNCTSQPLVARISWRLRQHMLQSLIDFAVQSFCWIHDTLVKQYYHLLWSIHGWRLSFINFEDLSPFAGGWDGSVLQQHRGMKETLNCCIAYSWGY